MNNLMKLIPNYGLNAFLILLLLTFSNGCKKENEFDTFDNVIEMGGVIDSPVEKREVLEESTETETEDGIIWNCTTETLSIQEGAGGNEGFPLFSPNSNVIYPGNLLQGASLSNATPDIIAVKRAGGKISTDVVDGNIQSTFQVDEISKSEVTDAINNIISGSTGIVPANFSLKIENIQSREQFALSLGLNVSSTFYDLEAKLGYSSDTEKNTFMVNLNQSFYTMSFDIPTSLDELFDASVTPDDLTKYVGDNNPATYISDVTYGRIYYMLIESSSSVTEMDAAINGSFNGVATQVDAEIDVNYLNELDELKITVFAYGGLASSALLTVGLTDLDELTLLLAEGSNIGSGKPLSYVVRSVYNNQIVSTQLATQYDIKNCEPIGAADAPPYTMHWTGSVLNEMGPIGAAYNPSGTEFILINKAGDQFMRSNVGSLDGPFPIDDLGTEDAPFQIGAACNIEGNQYGDFYLLAFDETGTQYAYMNPSGLWGDVHPISNYANGICPFNATGVGAMAFNFKDSYGPSGRYMFRNQGDQYAHYVNNPQSFGNTYELYQWGPDHSVTSLIDDVGAAIGFFLGDEKYYILFNKSGTKYVYYGNLNGNGTEVIGPFDL